MYEVVKAKGGFVISQDKWTAVWSVIVRIIYRAERIETDLTLISAFLYDLVCEISCALQVLYNNQAQKSALPSRDRC